MGLQMEVEANFLTNALSSSSLTSSTSCFCYPHLWFPTEVVGLNFRYTSEACDFFYDPSPQTSYTATVFLDKEFQL